MERRQLYVTPEAELLVVFFEKDFLGPGYNIDRNQNFNEEGSIDIFE